MRTWIALAPVLLLAACGKKPDGPATEPPKPAARTYKIGEDAAAGPMVHRITKAERLDAIPADRTIEEFKEIAAEKPAPDGCVWVFVKGQVTNRGADERSIKSISVAVVDGKGRSFDIATDVATFVPSDRLPTSIPVKPAASAEWEAYFPVAKDAKELRFVGTDCTFLGESKVSVDLGLQ